MGGQLFASMLLGPLIAPPIGGFLAARCALQPTDHRKTSGPSLAKSARSHDGLNGVALPKRGKLVACRLRDPFSLQARAAGRSSLCLSSLDQSCQSHANSEVWLAFQLLAAHRCVR